jgi:predicted TIM-barrel fold metal-dependent hydrolase
VVWSARRRRELDDADPALPLLPGEVSNGEFVPRAPSPRDRAIVAEVLQRADGIARRTGRSRREFLQSAGGVALTLAVVNACSGGDGGRGSSASSSSTTTTTGGRFAVPDPEDAAACAAALGGTGELIVDVHTHHVMPDGPWRQSAPAMEEMIGRLVPADCTDPDPLVCLDRLHYVHDLFLASDTTVAMLTDVPNSGPGDAPVPYAENLGTARFAASLAAGSAPRVLPQVVLAPNFGPLEGALDTISAYVESGKPASFKAYTAWGPDGRGYALDDPAIGLPVIQHIRDLGGRIVCGHKGLPLQGFDLSHNGPADMVAAAKLFPDLQFVVYHSAYERELTEGPYDPARAGRGTSSLLAALDQHGIPPNANVWCELGTLWREVLSHPDEAAHALGKLLTRVGEDRVLWGTDAIWYGSPQPQIMAFRTFEIAPALQEQFGYPALTPELKAKVFGRNAASLLGLDPEATYCGLTSDPVAAAKPAAAALAQEGALTPWRARGPLTRREVLTWLKNGGELSL